MPRIIPMKDLRGYLKPEEVDKLLNACKKERDYLLIRLLWRTGVRITELLNLKKKDIIWDERVILVETLKGGKGRKRRVPIDRETLNLLRKWMKGKKGKVFDFTRQYAFKIIRKIGKRAGITHVGEKKIHPHHFRHSFAVNWVKKGGDLRKLQRILGHASIATTAHYLQFSPTETRDEYDEIWGES